MCIESDADSAGHVRLSINALPDALPETLLLAEVDDATALALIAQANHNAICSFMLRPAIAPLRPLGGLGVDQLGEHSVAVAEPDIGGTIHRAHAMAIPRVSHANFTERIRAAGRRRHQLLLTPNSELHFILPSIRG
jgi:hypothetical protein